MDCKVSGIIRQTRSVQHSQFRNLHVRNKSIFSGLYIGFNDVSGNSTRELKLCGLITHPVSIVINHLRKNEPFSFLKIIRGFSFQIEI